jgi:hypothetical protein
MAALAKLFIAALPQVFDLVEDQSRDYRLTTFLFSRLGFIDYRQNFPIQLKTLPIHGEIFSAFFDDLILPRITCRAIITYN